MSDVISPDHEIDVLRREFDARFTQIPLPRPTMQRFLRLRAGDDLLLPLAQVRCVLPLPRLAPVPVEQSGLLGIGTAGGRTVAVYRLAEFIRNGNDESLERWLILPASGSDVAFAVAQIVDLVDVPAADLATVGNRDGPFIAIASIDARHVAVVDLSAIVHALSRGPVLSRTSDVP